MGADIQRIAGTHKSQQGGGTTHHTIIKPDPKIEAEKEDLEKKVSELEERKKASVAEQIEAGKEAIIKGMASMEITFPIPIEDRDKRNVGYFGNVSTGKTESQNVQFGLNNPVALSDMTEKCTKVYSKDGLNIWDMPGNNEYFRYLEADKLGFIKHLTKCVVMYNSTIKSVEDILKIVYALNPDSLMVVRSKVDEIKGDSSRTLEEEKERDVAALKELLGVEGMRIYAISSMNVKEGKSEVFDWEDFKKAITG